MSESIGHALPAGYRLREYRIERVLGEGGFGITYLAEDTQLGALRAIKEYLPGDLAFRSTGLTVRARSGGAAEDFAWGLERFLDEARTLARFEGHPNIVRVSHIIEENGTAYMVMNYHEGETLDQRLERQGLPDADTLWRILGPLLDGLAAVHGADMLHRDVKPANIYLRDDDTPILLDFGAARQSLSQRSRSSAAIVSEGYSPVEQYSAGSDRQGPWTDIYALAATFYRAIVGERPPAATDRALGTTMIPASEAGAGRFDDATLAAIDAGLAVSPDDRPADIVTWRAMLAADGTPVPITPSATPAADVPDDDSAEEAVIPDVNEPDPIDVEPTPAVTPPPQPRPMRWGRILGVVVVLAIGMALVAPLLNQAPRWMATFKESMADIIGDAPAKREQIYVALTTARVRARPAVDSDHVGSVPVGDTAIGLERVTGAPVTVAEQAQGAADWYRVITKSGIEGFVYAPLLGRRFRDCDQCPQLVVVDDGTFIMGSDDRPDEAPAHRVDIEHGFSIGRFEVTVGEWKACADIGACSQDLVTDAIARGNLDHPVTSVNWPDAMAFVDWLSAKTGRKYRLPSEAEWEYAARAGSTTSWSWGDRPEDACTYANVWDQNGRADFSHNDDQVPHDCRDGWTLTAPVGGYPANGFGLHDMTGNASEWTADCWHESHAGAPGDGTPRDGDCQIRVYKGGSWASGLEISRDASRQSGYEVERFDSHGLRVVRELEAR